MAIWGERGLRAGETVKEEQEVHDQVESQVSMCRLLLDELPTDTD